MSAGIAAAMVRAACKHPKVHTLEDTEEATKAFVPFQPQLLHIPEAFGADFVDSIAPFTDLLRNGHHQVITVSKVVVGSNNVAHQYVANQLLCEL